MDEVHVGNFLEEGKDRGGWFVGDYIPEGLAKTELVEVAVKEIHPGDLTPAHHHEQATELCLIISGVFVVRVGKEKVREVRLKAGEYMIVPPHVVSAWEMVDNKPAQIVVIRFPGAPHDKFYD